MKKNRKNVSIQRIIIIVSILTMLISISIIGYLIFTRWISTAEEMTESMLEDLSNNTYNQIITFLKIPEQLNEENHKIIQNGILDLSDEILRDKFFAGIIDAQHNAIYSFSYGTANGEYYGARRNENGTIEIMRNNATTGGNSWYYSVNEDLTAGDIVVEAGQFDPRTRAWYKVAEEAGKSSYSPVYKHFVMDDLTVSTAWPTYDNFGNLQGVLGTHMLLSDIGVFVEEIINKYNGYVIVFEKNTGNLIANSMGEDNFRVLQDGSFQHNRISDIEDNDIHQTYENFRLMNGQNFTYHTEDEEFFVNAREINREGLNWIVLSAIPEGLYMTNIENSIYLTALIAAIALMILFFLYHYIVGGLLKPMNTLLSAADALSNGDLSKRVKIVRNDEIGKISESFNSVAEKMQSLIDNLEYRVETRTEELKVANQRLQEYKNELQLILDSAAEAIYGIDLDGNCTFCNVSCLKMLGYSSQDELLGKNMHHQIHQYYRDGSLFPIQECKILQSIMKGKGFFSDDEVFWKADGNSFPVQYHAFPQIKNGKVIGAVITFMDITERKQKEEEIKYLSCHDILTGLHNRRCFDENRTEIDISENLPLSVIFADVNGLKMTNDIFGHAAGDNLIKQSAQLLKQACRENDTIARVGGDEFVLLLPKTDQETSEKIIARIRSDFFNANVAVIKNSISIGCDTKTSANQSLEEVIVNAENAMYKDKTLNRRSIDQDAVDNMLETLHSRSPKEKNHSIHVSELCGETGVELKLSELEINKLKRAGYLHDIGKIILDEDIFSKETLTEEEYEKMQQHSVVGYRILNLFDGTLDLAEYIYSHHERWDGNGYPLGLKGEQIPLIARVLAIAESYDRVLYSGELPFSQRKNDALKVIQNGAGSQFDPYIAKIFIDMIDKK